ncbi:MAG: Bug family tripartite tricarboxylate transporter substrate binding protein [Xanthobacteraceae bacterium]
MIRIVLLSVMVALASLPARAADFAGKTITIIVSTGAGGSYSHIAHSFARNMPRYLPGKPNMIVKNMPGAGNVLATNFMFNSAPKDGTTIATINNSIPLHQVLNGKGVRYDASKFNWLGSTGTYNSVAYVWHTAGVKTFKDLTGKEIILGGTGVGSSIVIYPIVMNNLLGAKFKIVLGYKSVAEIDVAMERGEVQARTGSYTALREEHPDWLKEKKVAIVAQVGSIRDKELKDIPLMTELAKTDEHRRIVRLISSPISLGRPFLTPPGVPADTVAVLRKAFQQTMRDPQFLKEAAKINLDVDPISADEIANIVNETIKTPPAILAAAKAAMVSRVAPERRKGK